VGLNYFLLKFFIETLGWYEHPTLSLMATAVIVVTFSYVSQRFFSFRADKAKPAIAEATEPGTSRTVQKKRNGSVIEA
jgi:putative flippase GtrA